MLHRSKPGEGGAREDVSCEGFPHNLHLIIGRDANRGQDFAEYGLLMFLIAIAVLGSIVLIGTQISVIYTEIIDKLPF